MVIRVQINRLVHQYICALSFPYKHKDFTDNYFPINKWHSLLHFCKTGIFHHCCNSVYTSSPTSWHLLFPELQAWWPLLLYLSQSVATAQHPHVWPPSNHNYFLPFAILICSFLLRSIDCSRTMILRPNPGFGYLPCREHPRKQFQVAGIL